MTSDTLIVFTSDGEDAAPLQDAIGDVFRDRPTVCVTSASQVMIALARGAESLIIAVNHEQSTAKDEIDELLEAIIAYYQKTTVWRWNSERGEAEAWSYRNESPETIAAQQDSPVALSTRSLVTKEELAILNQPLTFVAEETDQVVGQANGRVSSETSGPGSQEPSGPVSNETSGEEGPKAP